MLGHDPSSPCITEHDPDFSPNGQMTNVAPVLRLDSEAGSRSTGSDVSPAHATRSPEGSKKYTLGVHSEYGKLNAVIVSKPGLAHSRLTPGNCDHFLFDDVLWVERAQEDHAYFTTQLQKRGIEVLEFQDLLAETFTHKPEAIDWILQRRLRKNRNPSCITQVSRSASMKTDLAAKTSSSPRTHSSTHACLYCSVSP